MLDVKNLKPVVRFLLLAGVVTLAAACAKKEESTTAPSESSAAGAGTTSDGSTGATASPSSFDGQDAGGHLVKVAATNTMSPDQMAKAKSLAESKGCFACHQVEQKIVGPAFAWVAYKYKGNPKGVATLSNAIEHGVTGVWGPIPMPAQNVTPAEAKELASWVLAQKPIAPPKAS